MGYHDRKPRDLNNSGISFVNPNLQRERESARVQQSLERKLARVKEVLDNISDASVMTALDLKSMIERAMNEEDVK